jgi:hypothetical protein
MSPPESAREIRESDLRPRPGPRRLDPPSGPPGATDRVPSGPPATPRETTHAFTAALGHGDPETAAACLAQEVTLVTPDATPVSGRGTVRGVLAQLIGDGPTIAILSYDGEVSFGLPVEPDAGVGLRRLSGRLEAAATELIAATAAAVARI